MPTGISFTAVELCTYGEDITKPWFVYFDITDHSLGITVRKQFRGGINYYSSVKERLNAGDILKRYWEERLKDGWSPFMNAGVSNLSKMKFIESLDWALSKCNTASKTKKDYSSTVGFFKEAARKLGYDKAIISGIKKQHIMLMLDEIKATRKWSNNAYNKNTVYISGVLSRLVEYMVIEHNPAHDIKRLPVTESDMFETITDKEKLIIRDHITKTHPAYFTYLMLIYHTGIRPKECLALKLSDVHLGGKYIKIKPEIEEENSKTKTIRIVPLNVHILELLNYHLAFYDDHSFYLFGSPNASVGKRGHNKKSISGSIKTDYFLPSSFPIKRDTTTKWWKRVVWKELGIHKYQYALKHTGGDDKILAGIPIDALKEMYGHSSKFMTEKYAKKIKGVYREQIIVNSPDFLNKNSRPDENPAAFFPISKPM